MKKYIVIIISFFCIFSNWNAFFWWPSELDMFKNIDSWVEELEDKMLLFEANWWTEEKWILEEINGIAKIKKEKVCLDDSMEISQKDFEDIALKTDIKLLTKYVSEECKNNWSFSNDMITNYLRFFKTHYENSKKTAEKKSDKIYNLSKVWLFSDWILENSGFDLITDIEEIDKIIFASKNDYNWEENVDLSESIKSLLSWNNEDWDNNSSNTDSPNSWTNNNSSSTDNPNSWNDNISSNTDNTISWNKNLNNLKLSKYKPSLYKTNLINNENITSTVLIQNQYVCSEQNNNINNWLSTDNLNYLLNNITNWSNSISVKKVRTFADNEKIVFRYPEYWLDSNSIYADEKSNNSFNNSSNSKSNSSWWYKKVRDNSEWSCESFFCIDIDFIMYEHNLFWWSDNITIEYLLNRSNEHLSKFASTSMIPAKMSTNLFEIWLKDLNLPDIFHMAIEVTTKPIPLLKLEKEWTEDQTEFASKNLLEKYYDSYWLDYKRRNDIVLLNSKEQGKLSIINSQELSTENANEKKAEYNEYIKSKEHNIKIIEKSIEKRVSYWILDTFVEQYTELDKFTVSIYNYVENLHTIITNMRDIPIDKG